MDWIIYILIRIFGGAAKEVFLKNGTEKYSPRIVLLEQQVTTFLTITIVSLLIGTNVLPDSQSLIFIGLGIITALGSYGKIKAIKINLSASAIVRSFSPIFPILLAVLFLNEAEYFDIRTLNGILRIIALALFPISILLIRSNKLQKKGQKNSRWLLYILVMIIGHGLSIFLQKYFLEFDNVWKASVYMRLGGTLFALGYALYKKEKWAFSKNRFKYSVTAGLLGTVSTTANRWSLLTAPLSLVMSFKKPLEVIVLTTIGLFGYGERKQLTALQKIGFLLSALILVLILTTTL